jgi:adenylate cyclase
MEIERKYAIHYLPDNLANYQYKKIEQGYLCHNPIVRIRKSDNDYYMTYKSTFGIEQKSENSAIIHNEIELPLTKEAYETLKTKTEGNMIYKTRYLIPLPDGLTAELDIFEGLLTGLFFAEVEFPDEKIANEFCPPEWFGKELSPDRRFSNYSLSKLQDISSLS